MNECIRIHITTSTLHFCSYNKMEIDYLPQFLVGILIVYVCVCTSNIWEEYEWEEIDSDEEGNLFQLFPSFVV